MSHMMIETEKGPGPLAGYNSLTDNHLAGYFSSPRKRKHLRKVGLINRTGHLISESTVRLNMARKEHKKHIKNMLAQAIVEKTLDLERLRNNTIKQKLEEIAKLELVQRVREEEMERPITKKSSRPVSASPSKTSKTRSPQRRAQSAQEKRPREEDILPYLSPRSPRRPVSGPAKSKHTPNGKFRPISAPENNRPESGSTKESTNYDEDEEDIEYLDVTPRRNNGEVSYRGDGTLDYKQLYTLNAAALRKYAMTLAKLEQGRGSSSPYVTTQVPIPPKSPRAVNRSARSRRYTSGGQSERHYGGSNAAPAPVYSTETVTTPRMLQGMVQVTMRYHGWTLSLAREDRDPKNNVIIEQQHCGGNTLTVFKDYILPKSDFTFVSHRHRGYPFSLTIYVDGRMDSRVSTCCEHRHGKNVRLGGPNGHFSVLSVTGNAPCYKCQVERGGKKKKKKKETTTPEEGTEEVIVVETHPAPENKSEETEKNGQNGESDTEEEESENYDDDFEEEENEEKVKKETKVESKEEEVDTREIKGIAVESPRSITPESSPVTVVEKDLDYVQVVGRKIDAYSSEDEDLEGDKTKVVVVEIETKKTAPEQTQPKRPANQIKEKSKNQTSNSALTGSPKKVRISAPDEELKINIKEKTLDKEVSWDTETESDERSPRRDEVLPANNFKDQNTSYSKSSSNQNSPNKIPDIIHTVWSEEDTESSNEPEEWGDAQEKYNQKHTPQTYEADDEDTERGLHKSRGKKGASAIVTTFGQDESPENKNEKVASAIVKTFGQDETLENKNEKVASAIVKSFGQDESAENKNEKVASAIVKTFGQNESPENRREDIDKNNQSREEQPVVKESVALVSKSPGTEQTPHQPPKATDSFTEEVKKRKKESMEFFQPALEEKRKWASDTETGSSDTDSTSSSGSSSDTEEDVPMTTKTSAKPQIRESDNTMATSTSPKPSSASVANKSTKPNEGESEDTSSDSDSSGSSGSGSESSSSSDSEEEEETKKEKSTPTTKNQIIEQSKVNEKSEVTEHAQKENPRIVVEEDKGEDDEGIEPDAESPSHETNNDQSEPLSNQTDSQNHEDSESSKKPTSTKTKSVTFRNTPEPIENSEGDYEAGEQEEGNDILSKKGKMHGGSIQHLLEADKDIKFDGIHLDKHQVDELCDSLTENEELKTVSLLNSGLKDDELNKITDSIVTSPCEPVMLNLILNHLTSKSMEGIVDVMRAEPTLDILLLQGNEIGDEGVRILTEGIVDIHLDARKRRKTSLVRQSSELQVVQVHAHQDGSVPKAPMARRNSLFDPAVNARFCRLGELDLGDVGLTDAGVEHIAKMLEQNVYLETLSISSNPHITKNGWLRLGQALEKNRRLQTLTLDFNNIGDDGITFLCRGLKNNRTLMELDMEETGLSERGGRMLVELLKRNTTIHDMILMPGNDIPESIQLEIRRYLGLNVATDDTY